MIHTVVAFALLVLMVALTWYRHQQIKTAVHELEFNPATQFEVHRWATWYWVVNFPIVAVLFFGFPDVWVHVGLLLNTFYSLYANLATDYGSMSAARAAINAARKGQEDTNASLAELHAKMDVLTAAENRRAQARKKLAAKRDGSVVHHREGSVDLERMDRLSHVFELGPGPLPGRDAP